MCINFYAGVIGKFVYTMYRGTLNEINEAELCRQWAKDQNSTLVYQVVTALDKDGPGCPCNQMQAINDDRFVMYGKLEENKNCFYTFEEGFYLSVYGSLVSSI